MGEDPKLFRRTIDTSTPEIRLAACPACGHRTFPPVFLGCQRCGSDGLEELWLEARGRVLSSVEVPADDGELVVASIKLDDGPEVRVRLDRLLDMGTPVTAEVTVDDGERMTFREAP